MSRDLSDKKGPGLVVGVTKLAWMFGRSRAWAERLLREWETEQQLGGPTKVFRQGQRKSLFTTLPVIHQYMPPGRDLVLYRRMKAVEEDMADTNTRLDREVIERKMAVGELTGRVSALEGRRKAS